VCVCVLVCVCVCVCVLVCVCVSVCITCYEGGFKAHDCTLHD
jgi:hypothetical protein